MTTLMRLLALARAITAGNAAAQVAVKVRQGEEADLAATCSTNDLVPS